METKKKKYLLKDERYSYEVEISLHSGWNNDHSKISQEWFWTPCDKSDFKAHFVTCLDGTGREVVGFFSGKNNSGAD